MEIINATPKAVSGLVSKIEALKKQVKALKNVREDKALKPWMDAQDVLFTLSVTNRTLQTYRDKGMLSYTQVGQKYYYKPEDVEKLLVSVKF